MKYYRSDLNRPVIFQNHIDPVPDFIVKNILRFLNVSKIEYFEILEGDRKAIKLDDKTFDIVIVKKYKRK